MILALFNIHTLFIILSFMISLHDTSVFHELVFNLCLSLSSCGDGVIEKDPFGMADFNSNGSNEMIELNS